MATKLVSRNEKQKAYVRYGLEIIMMTVMGVTGMIVISIILHMKWAWIPFLISFSMLRSSAGGYHANCAESCFFISEGMFLLSVMIVKFFTIANEVYWVGYMIAWGLFWNVKLCQILAAVATLIAINGMNSTCFFFAYQPDMPEK